MTDTGTIIVCKACGHRAPFYLYRPARKYPGTVHCPECDSDNTEAERSHPTYEVPAAGYASEAEAMADWNTIAPQHRTQERLAKMLAAVR